MSIPKPPAKELPLFEQVKTALACIVPLEVHAQAEGEILRSNVADQASVNAAGLRAIEHFAAYFTDELAHCPEVSAEAIRNAAIFMFLGTVEKFKRAAILSMAGCSPNDAALDAEIVRH